ncbi:MAG: flexitail domain-containing putative surface protein, partial [Dehalococcoidia bacterium]|nr:flexitail domain-containing putative surface protein [Dehalococcoidia bacterium]
PLPVDFYPVADLNKNPIAAGLADSWRLTAKLPGAAIDFDGDGCNDQDELDKSRPVKQCGDDPYNPYDSDDNYDSSFSITVTVDRADWQDGNGGNVKAESGAQCSNNTDDDTFGGLLDYYVNDGCPPSGAPESGAQCDNNTNDDGDAATAINDGCPTVNLLAGSYFECAADIQHNKTTNALTARPYCYTDNPLTTVNIQDAGGAVGCQPLLTAPKSRCGDGLSGAAPPGANSLGDVDNPHTTLTGQYNKATNQLELSGCFNNVENPTQGPSIWADVTVDAHTGEGTVDIFLNQANGCPGGGVGTPNVADVSITEQQPKDPSNAALDWDTDQDGCSDKQELQSGSGSEAAGGLRDPTNRWDFYDTDNNRVVDLFIDIFGVAGQFGLPGNDKTNRASPLVGSAGPWNIRGPDATVDLFNDIFGVANQFGHDCS